MIIAFRNDDWRGKKQIDAPKINNSIKNEKKENETRGDNTRGEKARVVLAFSRVEFDRVRTEILFRYALAYFAYMTLRH